MYQSKSVLECELERREIIVCITVGLKFLNRAGTEKEVARGFRKISVAEGGNGIRGFLQTRPDSIKATLFTVSRADWKARLVDHAHPGANQLDAGMPLQVSDASGKPRLMVAVVGIQNRDKIAFICQCQAPIERRMCALIFLFD